MLLFRIDTSSEFNDRSRQYGFPETERIILKGSAIERFIAQETAEEINGSNKRRLISYSKSLGVCLLKYNNYLDNRLLFSNIPFHTCAGYTALCYCIGHQNYSLSYFLQTGLWNFPFEEAELVNFIVDVSDNNIIQTYFQKHLGKGKKPFASPEKDKEVVLMRSLNEKIIDADNLGSVYTLYGLSIKYNFLSDEQILCGLIGDVYNAFNEGRYSEDELQTIICLIQYMAYHGDHERKLSEAIRERNSPSERIPFCYDPICEYNAIISSTFLEAYEMSYNSENVITHALWKWCGIFLGISYHF